MEIGCICSDMPAEKNLENFLLIGKAKIAQDAENLQWCLDRGFIELDDSN